MLVGIEMSRACLMAVFSRRSPWLALAVLSLLFSCGPVLSIFPSSLPAIDLDDLGLDPLDVG